MSIHRWIDKEAAVHIYNGILLSHTKEWIWVSCSEMDELRACYTGWSKSNREKQITYTNINDAKAETPVLWPPHVKSWLIAKDSDAGRDWGQEEKGTTEDEMAGWHHRLDGREFEWALRFGDGQGGLCFYSWGHKESDMTEQLNWTKLRPLEI